MPANPSLAELQATAERTIHGFMSGAVMSASDAYELARFVRRLLSLEVHPSKMAVIVDDGMVVLDIAPGVRLKYEPEDARRRAADLLRAAEQAQRKTVSPEAAP